jgi:hypothetical protein
MRLNSLLFVILISCIGFNSFAKDVDGAFSIKGVGALSCDDFIKAAKGDAPILQQYAGYVSGYISAYNELETNTFDLLPWQQLDTVMLLLLQGCKQTPNSTVGGAVSRIKQYFSENSVQKNVKKIEIKGQDQSMFFYPIVVKQIKNALIEQGYNTNDLWYAMLQFQQDRKLIGKHPFEQMILMTLLYGKKSQ